MADISLVQMGYFHAQPGAFQVDQACMKQVAESLIFVPGLYQFNQ
jgi:hypothetical protein